MYYLNSIMIWGEFVNNRIVPDLVNQLQRQQFTIAMLDEVINQAMQEHFDGAYALAHENSIEGRHFVFATQEARLAFILRFGDVLGSYDTYDFPELWRVSDPGSSARARHRHINP